MHFQITTSWLLAFVLFLDFGSCGDAVWLVFAEPPPPSKGQQQFDTEITNSLQKILDSSQVLAIHSQWLAKVAFWRIEATEDEAEAARRIPGIETVERSSPLEADDDDEGGFVPSSSSPSGNVTNFDTSELDFNLDPIDLRLLSWPPNKDVPRADLIPPYKFNPRSSRDPANIYVIDMGVNVGNEVFPYCQNDSDISYDRGTTIPTRTWREIDLHFMDLMTSLEINIVLAAGNHADRSASVDTFPARLPNSGGLFITAGAATQEGNRELSSQFLPNEPWAIGEKVACAGLPGQPQTVIKSGTSFAAPARLPRENTVQSLTKASLSFGIWKTRRYRMSLIKAARLKV
ncbi:uncharacterized protein KY384_000101 [Bacidia gigantensis]|uniref:uncharacterized protein n=1 Tax=Bacidia gigantensis TaxID=2732470 RepID=UPI001D0380A9|nr:uncharacterized protein KY384_000101 [Bacidia gigantensis]KAG8526108.1 hypothetical protein KY384_000101 [Bacidia gigantensis]